MQLLLVQPQRAQQFQVILEPKRQQEQKSKLNPRQPKEMLPPRRSTVLLLHTLERGAVARLQLWWVIVLTAHRHPCTLTCLTRRLPPLL